MAGVPLAPAQWTLAIPPGGDPKQKPDPTALILTPIADRFPLECDWFLQDWAPRSPADWWLASDRRAASLTLFERAVRELPDDRAAALRQTLRSAGETTVESVLRLYQQVGRERRQQRLAALLARLVGGQVVDIDSEGKAINTTLLEYIHRHKTGTLITASVLLGGTLGGASPEEIKHLRAYGEAVGHAYQITDDILDILGSKEELGKNTGRDQKKSKATYPSIIGMEEAEKKQLELYQRALESLESFDGRADHLRKIALYIIQRHR